MVRNFLKALATSVSGVAMFGLLVAPVLAQRYDYLNNGDAGVGAALGVGLVAYYLCICCLVIVGLVIKVWVAYSIGKDAEYKKLNNGLLWSILYFFFGDLALAIYFWQQKDMLKAEIPMMNNSKEEAKK